MHTPASVPSHALFNPRSWRTYFIATISLPVVGFVIPVAAQPKLLTAANAWQELLATSDDLPDSGAIVDRARAKPDRGEARNNPGPTVKIGGNLATDSASSAGQVKTKDRSQKRSRAAASLAKDFYTRFPNDPNAAKARKMEVQALIRGLKDGNVDGEAEAYRAADAFRADSTNDPSDRFDVAWVEERRKVRDKANARKAVDTIPALDRLADKLRRECGDVPRVYYIYDELMRGADSDTAFAIASKLVSLPAPKYLKDKASDEVDRHRLKGKKPALNLTTTDGQSVDFSPGKGKCTILYVTRSADRVDLLNSAATKNQQWVRLIVDPSGKSDASKATASSGGVLTCIESQGLKGPTSSTLKIPYVPYVVVFDEHGKVQDYGNAGMLADLVQEVSK